jgi:hypothetical protein
MNGSIPDLTALASLIAINVSDNVFTDNFFSGEICFHPLLLKNPQTEIDG